MAITWSDTSLGSTSRKGVADTGDEAAPTGASDGLALEGNNGVYGVVVFVEATDGATNLTAGRLDYYGLNKASGNWCLIEGLRSSGNVIGGAKRVSLPTLRTVAFSRITAVPKTLGTPVTIYLHGLSTVVA